ncbi:MAG: death-on-curing protein [Nitrospirales bacterium]|nr:MAG: death-on-curing protein [Nitrospirales bacterium]
MKESLWVSKELVLAIHDKLLAEHGGGTGLRDEGLLDSALARPENLFSYEKVDLFGLAAAYTHGILRNHPFIDGNKRTAFLTGYVFLGKNNEELVASEAEATQAILDLVSKKFVEVEYAMWLKEHC